MITQYRVTLGFTPFYWQLYNVSASNPVERMVKLKVGPFYILLVRPPAAKTTKNTSSHCDIYGHEFERIYLVEFYLSSKKPEPSEHYEDVCRHCGYVGAEGCENRD